MDRLKPGATLRNELLALSGEEAHLLSRSLASIFWRTNDKDVKLRITLALGLGFRGSTEELYRILAHSPDVSDVELVQGVLWSRDGGLAPLPVYRHVWKRPDLPEATRERARQRYLFTTCQTWPEDTYGLLKQKGAFEPGITEQERQAVLDEVIEDFEAYARYTVEESDCGKLVAPRSRLRVLLRRTSLGGKPQMLPDPYSPDNEPPEVKEICRLAREMLREQASEDAGEPASQQDTQAAPAE